MPVVGDRQTEAAETISDNTCDSAFF